MIDFWKLHGAGNDFILVDNSRGKIEDLSLLASTVCHRRYGVGADGLMTACPSAVADIRMVYYNSDGSPAAMCGNGIRCFSKFVRDMGLIDRDAFTVETGDGVKKISISEESLSSSMVEVEMGTFTDGKAIALSADDKEFECIFTHFGVPHTVIFVDPTATKAKLIEMAEKYGPSIEVLPLFPQGTNVNFVQVLSGTELYVSTWERGAGRTLACGTGACASAAAARQLGLVQLPAAVRMPGGRVTVGTAAAGAGAYTKTSSPDINPVLTLSGEAHFICKGQLLYSAPPQADPRNSLCE